MKKSTLLLIVFLAEISSSKAQYPWQQLNENGTKEIAANFASPPSEYGIVLWWGWDGPVTDTLIKYDLDRIKAMGFRGVMIEAGYGMTAKYLSPEWFSLVKVAVDEAGKRGMRVWIEDEGKYPSGFAGGKFSSDRPDLKMQGLVITEKINVRGGDSILKKLPYYTISAAAYNNDDKTTKILDVSSGELKWRVPEGNWIIYLAGHRFRSSVTRSVNNPSRGKDTTASLFDYLNPIATQQFIYWTHEQYKKYIGSEFGKTFMGFMGDEPDFAYTPWTPGIPEEFRKKKGYDVTPYLASFFAPQLNEETKRIKADYWDVWSDLFRDNFFSVQSEWCRKNKIEYIVHLNHEDQMPGLVKSSGDFFKNMRNVGVPGVDAIWSQIWMDHIADYPKLASSAAHLYGHPRAFTESFAAYTHRPTVPQAKWVLDYQLVRGINSIQVMFMSASASRARNDTDKKNGSTAIPVQQVQRTSFFMSDTFPPVAQYLNRATYLLSQGRPAAQIGVYFPTRSMWYGDNESNTSVTDIARQLTETQHDFDFVDEQALSKELTVNNGALQNLSGQSYKTIVIASISTISVASLVKLKELVSEGGKVIFSGILPSLVTDKTFLNARKPDSLEWFMYEPLRKSTYMKSEDLPPPDLKTNIACPHIKYLHRIWKDADMYFIFNESEEPVTLEITFAGRGKAREWVAASGKIVSLNCRAVKDNVKTKMNFGGWDTKFVVISK
jgi:hypothetical protein